MYTPPVTPWESVMPEVGDLTPSAYEPHWLQRSKASLQHCKKYVPETNIHKDVRSRKGKRFMCSRGKEPPKAGLITGVKS